MVRKLSEYIVTTLSNWSYMLFILCLCMSTALLQSANSQQEFDLLEYIASEQKATQDKIFKKNSASKRCTCGDRIDDSWPMEKHLKTITHQRRQKVRDRKVRETNKKLNDIVKKYIIPEEKK